MKVSNSQTGGAVDYLETGDAVEEVYRKRGACALLKIQPRTLDDWMRKGLPYIKLPSGAVRFRRTQLLEFLAKFETRRV
jgi:predicted site-specific integrase-resolvase